MSDESAQYVAHMKESGMSQVSHMNEWLCS